jgi:hypothetical protein
MGASPGRKKGAIVGLIVCCLAAGGVPATSAGLPLLSGSALVPTLPIPVESPLPVTVPTPPPITVTPPAPPPVPVTPAPPPIPVHVTPPPPVHLPPPPAAPKLPAPPKAPAPSVSVTPPGGSPVTVTTPSTASAPVPRVGALPSGKTPTPVGGTATSLPQRAPARSASASGPAAATSPFSSYGSGSATGAFGSAPRGPGPAALVGREVAALAGLTLGQKVQRLAGCLSDLPERPRLVLELSAGIGTGRSLTLAGLSRRLNVTVAQARQLQRRALRRLILAARTHACVSASGTSTGQIADLAATVMSADLTPFGAAGGVLAARYSKSPTQEGDGLAATQAPPDTTDGLALIRTPGGNETLNAIAIALTGMLLLGVLFAEELAVGPRVRRARARWLRRPHR